VADHSVAVDSYHRRDRKVVDRGADGTHQLGLYRGSERGGDDAGDGGHLGRVVGPFRADLDVQRPGCGRCGNHDHHLARPVVRQRDE